MSVDIEKVVIETVAKSLKIDPAKITSDSRFVDDLRADSLDTVELMMAIEAECKIDIPDEDASKIVKVSDVIDYIKAKQN
ncbi:MAG: acyl carrier protein [Candidatus Rickettsia vulgarisii]